MDIVAMQKIKNPNKMGKKSEKNGGWLMTMLRVLLHGPGCVSKYGRCGCAKKRKNQNKAKSRGWLMTNVGCPVSGSRVHFQIWKVWLCKNSDKIVVRIEIIQTMHGAMLSGSMSGSFVDYKRVERNYKRSDIDCWQ
jgi:hypothetical protein